MVLTVYGKRGRRDVVVGHLMHVPQATTRALARAAGRGDRSFRAVAGPAGRLAGLGLERSDIRSARHVVQLDSVGDGYTTATTIAMMHPNVATIDKTAAGATKTLLAQTPAVGALGRTITGMQDRGRNLAPWCRPPTRTATPRRSRSATRRRRSRRSSSPPTRTSGRG